MDDDDELTIDHLNEEVCVFNNSFEVTVVKDAKTNQTRLVSDGRFFFVVKKVIDLTEDGGYILDLISCKGKQYSNVSLIAKRLFQ